MADREIYRVERAAAAERDLDALFDFLVASYVQFGDTVERAFERAMARALRIKEELRQLGKIPHQGTLHPQLLHDLRSVTKDRAIFYFTVDDEARIVRVLAVFFGGQDHRLAMLRRLLSG